MHNQHLATLTVALLALSLSACSSGAPTQPAADQGSEQKVVIGQPTVNGPALKAAGKWTTVKRTGEQFHAIELKDCANVQVTVGVPLDVTVMADANLIDVVVTKVEAGKLEISFNKSFQCYRAPEVIIGVPELSQIKMAGSGEMSIVAVKGDIFNVDLSGSGKFKGAGRVINEKLNVSGSGTIDCSQLVAENATLDVSGSGTCKAHPAKTLKAKVSGSGKILYKGNPTEVNRMVSGSGTINVLPN